MRNWNLEQSKEIEFQHAVKCVLSKNATLHRKSIQKYEEKLSIKTKGAGVMMGPVSVCAFLLHHRQKVIFSLVGPSGTAVLLGALSLSSPPSDNVSASAKKQKKSATTATATAVAAVQTNHLT